MDLNNIILTIEKSAKLWHDSEDGYANGIDQDIRLLIGKYIMHKGHNHLIGKYTLSSIVNVFEEQTVGQNDEPFCGFEEEMLLNAIQMYEDKESLNTLIDNDPIEGKYQIIDHIDKDIHMIINYFEALFWPDIVEMRYNLSDFNIER